MLQSDMRLFLLLIMSLPFYSYSKVEPPNYDFSLDAFELFMPGKKLEEINKIYKFSEIIFKESGFITYKYYVEHIRYRFPILVQTQNGIVTDFYARLPHYFLHDIFHQSLINRLGKQDHYQKTEESALYIWKNKNNNQHIYSGACTITCFPLYYSVVPIEKSRPASLKPLIKRLQEKPLL
jgi:hypothetical protein